MNENVINDGNETKISARVVVYSPSDKKHILKRQYVGIRNPQTVGMLGLTFCGRQIPYSKHIGSGEWLPASTYKDDAYIYTVGKYKSDWCVHCLRAYKNSGRR